VNCESLYSPDNKYYKLKLIKRKSEEEYIFNSEVTDNKLFKRLKSRIVGLIIKNNKGRKILAKAKATLRNIVVSKQ
jgi:hypothetical protein